eukprot:g71980.t1
MLELLAGRPPPCLAAPPISERLRMLEESNSPVIQYISESSQVVLHRSYANRSVLLNVQKLAKTSGIARL